MKHSKKSVRRRSFQLPRLRFRRGRQTSFAGLVIVGVQLGKIRFLKRLNRCFRGVANTRAYDPQRLFQLLVIMILMGFRTLSDHRFFRDDPLVERVSRLKKLPSTATLSRFLASMTDSICARLRSLLRELVLESLSSEELDLITLDFDGSVLASRRRAEGIAKGYASKSKGGRRSYYPLFCTVAQTGQVLDFLFRSGNIHDSQGSGPFIRACVTAVRSVRPRARLEARLDGAFFSEATVELLEKLGVEYTVTGTKRDQTLKEIVEQSRDDAWDELPGIPRDEPGAQAFIELPAYGTKSWKRKRRFLLVRTQKKVQQKGPIQLDLFEPVDLTFEYKIIVTNKACTPKHVIRFHEGRGTQEKIFAELKSDAQLGHIPVNRRAGNEAYLIANLFAHNLNRRMQMLTRPRRSTNTVQRAPLWQFEKMDTIRRLLIQRAGTLSRPGNRLTLTIAGGKAIEEIFHRTIETLQAA